MHWMEKFSDSRKKSYVDRSSNRVVAGVLSRSDTKDRFVELYAGDILLRRVPVRPDDLNTQRLSKERSPKLQLKFRIKQFLKAGIESFPRRDPFARRFSFSLHPTLERLIPKGTIIQVRDCNGQALPYSRRAIVGAIGQAEDDGNALRAALQSGMFVDKWGALKTPFAADLQKRELYANQMISVIDFFDQRFGIVAFPHYGSLLGLVRTGKFIDHDDDVDLSIAIRGCSLSDAVAKYYDIVDALVEEGHRVDLLGTGQIQFRRKDTNGPLLDVFLTWGEDELEFNTYFGVCGRLKEPLAFEDAALEGRIVKMPVQCRDILELTFGPSWSVPDTSFVWQAPAHVGRVMARLQIAGEERLKRVKARQEELKSAATNN